MKAPLNILDIVDAMTEAAGRVDTATFLIDAHTEDKEGWKRAIGTELLEGVSSDLRRVAEQAITEWRASGGAR